MRVAVKPVITTGVVLVGASVIAAAPIEPPAYATARVVEQDVSLTASSVAYLPINVIEQVFSAPANMVAALDRLATALVISGSWNDSHPNNVWGWDPANPAMFREMINTLVPFPAFSQPWGTHLDWWATANLPMYAGCAYECEDLPGMLDLMFKVPMSEFYSEDGYTFPTVINPIDGVETEWSGKTIKLDPAEPIRSFWNSLTAEPTGIQTVSWYEVVTAVANFGAALQITGHLPDWVAVREIERFVKIFLPAPQEDAVPAVTDDEADQLPEASALAAGEPNLVNLADLADFSTVGTVRALDAGATEGAVESETAASSLTDASPAAAPAESPVAQIPLLQKVTSELKKKFESAPADEVAEELSDDEVADAKDAAAKDDSADEAAKDEADAAAEDGADSKDESDAEADTSTTSGGKHRKSDDSTDKDSSPGTSSSASGGDKSDSSGSGGGSDSSD